MACFLVPVAEAVITTVATKVVKSKEKKSLKNGTSSDAACEDTNKIKFSTKLGWLNKMLWGGSALLAFEHLWHGEVVPFFPFLTAVESGDTAEMLMEMGTVGVAMSVAVTLVWGVMLAVSSVIEKRARRSAKAIKEDANA